MNKTNLAIILALLLSSTVESNLWYDSDSSDGYLWVSRVPVILNETVGLDRVDEPVLISLAGFNFSSVRVVDPQKSPDGINEVGGDDIPYQITGDGLLFRGNVSRRSVKLYYIYLANDPIKEITYPGGDLRLSYSRNGMVVENSEAVWEISSSGYHFGVSRYENREYNSSIARSQGIGWGERVRSGGGDDYFTGYGRNWNCSVLDSGPLLLRINCSANSSEYKVERFYSFYSRNSFFEVEDRLEKLDLWAGDARFDVRSRLAPYFNRTGSYKFEMREQGSGGNKTFYMAARDIENGTGRYVFWVMGRGDFRSISFRDYSDFDSFDYTLHLSDINVTGFVRYLFREGGILDSRLEYEGFITPLASLGSTESNILRIHDVRDYDRVYDRNKFVSVETKTDQVYGTEKVTCRVGDLAFPLYDDGTHGDLYGLDGVWADNRSLRVTDNIPTGEYVVYCEAFDRLGNTVFDSSSFSVFDRGSYHRIDFAVGGVRVRPGGFVRVPVNVSNMGHFSESGIRMAVDNLPVGWNLILPGEFNLEMNESRTVFLGLDVPSDQGLGEIPLQVGVGSRDMAEKAGEGMVDVVLYEVEADLDVSGDRLVVEFGDEYGDPVDNARVTVYYYNESSVSYTDGGGRIYVGFNRAGDIGIDLEKTGYVPFFARVGLRKREVSYWFPVTAFVIICLTLLIAWFYWQTTGRDDVENAIVVALVLGVLITLVWVGVTMRGKEPFTALYFMEGSYSNYLDGNYTRFGYVVDCWEHEPTRYELDIFLGDTLVDRDSFWLCRGDEMQVSRLEREKAVKVPGDLSLPARVRLVLRAGNSSYDIHYFLRGRVAKPDNLSSGNLTCGNGILDSGESDVDCGGSCAPCDSRRACTIDPDCLTGFCLNRTCREPSCLDGVRNQGELDIDCGGQCIPCHCFDSVLDLDESDVDCGGQCISCGGGMACIIDPDCLTGFCLNRTCREPSCLDGVRNQGEVGVDCGGPCGECPSCFDGVRNQGELDTDCAGPCPGCDLVYGGNRTHVSWVGRVDGFVSSVSLNPDGSYVAVASNGVEGWVALFGNSSLVRWSSQVLSPLTDVRFAGDGRFISPYPEADLYLFDFNGVNRMSDFADRVGDVLSVCGVSRASEVFFSFGRVENRWVYEVPFSLHRIDFTGDCVYRVEGQREKGNFSSVSLFENNRLLWRRSAGGDVYSLAVSDNASYVVVGAGGRRLEEDNFIYLFDRRGRLLWSYPVDWNIHSLGVSGDGRFILAGSRSGRAYLLNGSGGLLWTYDTGSDVLDLDIAPGGGFAVFGTADGSVYFMVNPLFNCSDGFRNQGEIDVDCGGPCPLCGEDRVCLKNFDCLSGFCYRGVCGVPSCFDGIRNQGEVGVDCGGPCLPCRPACARDLDCGKDVVSVPYCYGDYILRNVTYYRCVDPGNLTSYCEFLTDTRVDELCLGDFKCFEGVCVGGDL